MVFATVTSIILHEMCDRSEGAKCSANQHVQASLPPLHTSSNPPFKMSNLLWGLDHLAPLFSALTTECGYDRDLGRALSTQEAACHIEKPRRHLFRVGSAYKRIALATQLSRCPVSPHPFHYIANILVLPFDHGLQARRELHHTSTISVYSYQARAPGSTLP